LTLTHLLRKCNTRKKPASPSALLGNVSCDGAIFFSIGAKQFDRFALSYFFPSIAYSTMARSSYMRAAAHHGRRPTPKSGGTKPEKFWFEKPNLQKRQKSKFWGFNCFLFVLQFIVLIKFNFIF